MKRKSFQKSNLQKAKVCLCFKMPRNDSFVRSFFGSKRMQVKVFHHLRKDQILKRTNYYKIISTIKQFSKSRNTTAYD